MQLVQLNPQWNRETMSILGGPEGDTLKKDHVITWPTNKGQKCSLELNVIAQK